MYPLGKTLLHLLVLLGLLSTSPMVAAQTPEQQGTRKRIAVLVLSGGDTPRTLADNLTEILIAAVSRRNQFEIVGKEEFQSILGLRSDSRAINCLHDTICLSKVGVELGISEIILGNLGGKGDRHTLILDRVNVAQGRVAVHLSTESTGGVEGLNRATFALADQLFLTPPDGASKASETAAVEQPGTPAQAAAPKGDGDRDDGSPQASARTTLDESPQIPRSAVLIALGVGATSLAAAVAFGIRVNNQASEVAGRCCIEGARPRDVYDLTRTQALSLKEEADQAAFTANVFYGVSVGAFAAAGALLYLSSPESSTSDAGVAVPVITGDSVGLHWSIAY